MSKLIGAGALATSLAFLPLALPASAQNSGETTDSTSGTSSYQGTDSTRGDRDFDWGWLGLIGLAGLAGLAKGKRSEPVAYRDPNPTR